MGLPNVLELAASEFSFISFFHVKDSQLFRMQEPQISEFLDI